MDDYWLTWERINSIVRDRELVLYGRSDDWIPKTLRRLGRSPKYIIDGSPSFKGAFYRDIPIYLPSHLETENKDNVFVVITTGNYQGVVSVLEDLGFTSGLDFSCSPEFKSMALLEEIRNYDAKVIVACSDYNVKTASRYSQEGGGLYVYDLMSQNKERVAKGSYRQMARIGGDVYAIEHALGEIHCFDDGFKLKRAHQLGMPKYCGLAYDNNRDLIVAANTETDCIDFFDRRSFKKVECVHYSDKTTKEYSSQHHINDICIDEDTLFVCYFSHSGNWKRGVFDGGVSQIPLGSLKTPPEPIVTGLWQPHSPEVIQGNICYLDSLRGRLRTTTHVIHGEFSGFTRGLTHDGRFFFIGQSENMYASRLVGTSNNIMLNAGFYLFDTDTKVSRFYPMFGNMNIHDLLPLVPCN